MQPPPSIPRPHDRPQQQHSAGPGRASGPGCPGHTGPPGDVRARRAWMRPTLRRRVQGAQGCGAGAEAEARRPRAGGRGRWCPGGAGREAARGFAPPRQCGAGWGATTADSYSMARGAGRSVTGGILPNKSPVTPYYAESAVVGGWFGAEPEGRSHWAGGGGRTVERSHSKPPELSH